MAAVGTSGGGGGRPAAAPRATPLPDWGGATRVPLLVPRAGGAAPDGGGDDGGGSDDASDGEAPLRVAALTAIPSDGGAGGHGAGGRGRPALRRGFLGAQQAACSGAARRRVRYLRGARALRARCAGRMAPTLPGSRACCPPRGARLHRRHTTRARAQAPAGGAGSGPPVPLLRARAPPAAAAGGGAAPAAARGRAPPVPDFLLLPPDARAAARDGLLSALRPTPDMLGRISGDPVLAAGFEDPEVMAAVADVAADPARIAKYRGSAKVLRFYAAMGQLAGARLEEAGGGAAAQAAQQAAQQQAAQQQAVARAQRRGGSGGGGGGGARAQLLEVGGGAPAALGGVRWRE